MRSSANIIAASLEEFSHCLRDTELPNDVRTTAHVLDSQCAERDAIKVRSTSSCDFALNPLFKSVILHFIAKLSFRILFRTIL